MGEMKSERGSVSFLMVGVLLFILSSAAYAEGTTENKVSSEKKVTGSIREVSVVHLDGPQQALVSAPSQVTPPATPPATPPTAATVNSQVVSNVKEYRISLYNLSDKYDLTLTPTFQVKAGNAGVLPIELKKGDLITVTYKDDKDTGITSVSLDKVKAGPGVLFWSVLIGVVITVSALLLFDNSLKKMTGVKGGLLIGLDNRYSNSKTQMVIWTFLVIFTYATLFFQRWFGGLATSIPYSYLINIPQNLGILMGISAGSFLGAKAITSSKVASGSITKTKADDSESSLVDLITNDSKAIDLGDAQMIAWTLVATVVYLFNFLRMWYYLDPSAEVSLPDIDSTLLALTGVSQAAYLGKKLVSSDTKPTIASIDPADHAKLGDQITINGTAFGNQQGTVKLGDEEIGVVSWYDSVILARIRPVIQGQSIPTGKTVLSVATAYEQVITAPYKVAETLAIAKVDPPAEAKPNDTATITGTGFGDESGEVTLGPESLKIAGWTDSKILVKLEAAAQGHVLPTGKTVLRVKSKSGQTATVDYNLLP